MSVEAALELDLGQHIGALFDRHGAARQKFAYDARGDWRRAHAEAQADEGAAGAWVHAYLHRKGGDLGNAGYWYRRAGKPVASGPLDLWPSDRRRGSASKRPMV